MLSTKSHCWLCIPVALGDYVQPCMPEEVTQREGTKIRQLLPGISILATNNLTQYPIEGFQCTFFFGWGQGLATG